MRRRLVRISATLAVLLVLVLVASTVTVVTGIRRSLPAYDGHLTLPRLAAPVEVRRDEWGVPQIYADTPEDLFRTQGYVQAQDRFFEMDFRRHLTSGRLSEWFGRSQLDTDRFIRTIGWRHVAEQEFNKLSTTTRSYLQAYAEGVNAYLGEHSGSALSVEYTMGLLGPEERPAAWDPVDSLAWLKAMAWDLRSNLEDEIARTLASTRIPDERVADLYPPYPFDRRPPIVTDPAASARARGGEPAAGRTPSRSAPNLAAGPETLPAGTSQALAGIRKALDAVPSGLGAGSEGTGLGSNSWVVAGSRTTTGKPLLANDPHLTAQMPGIWYQMGLHCRRVSQDCPYDVSGFTFAGLPGVVIGHNRRIAWGFTNLGTDVTDLYIERIRGDTYLYDDERHPLAVRRERIAVKGEDPVEIVVRATRHGPLLSDVSREMRKVGESAPAGRTTPSDRWRTGVALRWTALEPGRTADAIFQLNAASDWKGFREAAARFEVPAQNMLYADVDGHIGYQAPGRVPVRRRGSGEWPAPGWTSDYGWVAWVPFEDLPSELDPKDGYIVTANNAAVGPSYPYHLADNWAYGSRSGRIADRIEAAGKLDVAAMRRIQLDSYDANAEFLVPYLRRVDLDGFSAAAQPLLEDWDLAGDADSAAAAYFNAVWRNLLRLTFHDQLPRDAWPEGGDRWWEVLRRLVKDPDGFWWDDVRTKGVREDRDEILREAMVDARYELTQLLSKSPDRWRWGRLHQLELVNQTFGESGIGPLEALFNRGPYEVGGGNDAVLATSWLANEETYDAVAVPSMRMVVDLADLDRSRWVNLTGASGHPWSPHYADQAELWVRGRTTAWPFGREAVRRATAHTLTLAP